MNNKTYVVTLTNGTVESDYVKHASCEEAAVILAQAEAIGRARGYILVDVKILKK